jgi:O-antigen ligase
MEAIFHQAKKSEWNSLWAGLLFLAFLFLAAVVLPLKASVVILGGFVALPVAMLIAFRFAQGDAEPVVLLWVLVFPLGYYFLAFPKNGSIFNFDRFIIGVLFFGILLCPVNRMTRVPCPMQRSAWAWAGFLLAATLSLVTVKLISGSARLLLEGFIEPAILGWYLIACFPVLRRLNILHAVVCVTSIYTAAIGLAEMRLGTDLLPLPGAGEYMAGQEGLLVLRVNGPYLTNNSFGLIGLISLCFLWFLRSAIGSQMRKWQRILHYCGMSAAAAAALMPLFRSIFLTLVIILCLDLLQKLSWKQRVLRISLLVIPVLGVIATMILIPEIFEERVSDPQNVYGRIAQQQQNFRLFLDHPLNGVGLNNFHTAAIGRPSVGSYYQGVESLDFPHSNLGAILAETGTLGFLPYILSQVFLFGAFWKLRKLGTPAGKLVWRFFLYIFLSYWITGLALTSGYYSDLNLWFLFCLAIIYKFGITVEAEHKSETVVTNI